MFDVYGYPFPKDMVACEVRPISWTIFAEDVEAMTTPLHLHDDFNRPLWSFVPGLLVVKQSPSLSFLI